MNPSNEQINEWLKVAEALPGPRFVTFATLAAEWGAKQEREACAKLVEDKFDFCGDELTAAAAIRSRGEVKP